MATQKASPKVRHRRKSALKKGNTIAAPEEVRRIQKNLGRTGALKISFADAADSCRTTPRHRPSSSNNSSSSTQSPLPRSRWPPILHPAPLPPRELPRGPRRRPPRRPRRLIPVPVVAGLRTEATLSSIRTPGTEFGALVSRRAKPISGTFRWSHSRSSAHCTGERDRKRKISDGSVALVFSFADLSSFVCRIIPLEEILSQQELEEQMMVSTREFNAAVRLFKDREKKYQEAIQILEERNRTLQKIVVERDNVVAYLQAKVQVSYWEQFRGLCSAPSAAAFG